MSTPHNSAQPGDIAPSVLLPGDPLRAKYVAEKYLTGAKQITGVRNMLGFTGMYGNTPVTVMGSGMGGPSCGIYSYELFSFYNVEQIIRIGTAGGLAQNLKVGDLVFAMTASTDSNWAHQYNLNGSFSPCGRKILAMRLVLYFLLTFSASTTQATRPQAKKAGVPGRVWAVLLRIWKLLRCTVPQTG